MNAETLMELAGRVEAACGPSYALDCEVWDAVYPGERQARFDKLTEKGQPYHNRLNPADLDGYIQPLRAFTASIDAALTLVPEGWLASIDVRIYGRGSVVCFPPEKSSFTATMVKAATPALALTASALKARAQEGK